MLFCATFDCLKNEGEQTRPSRGRASLLPHEKKENDNAPNLPQPPKVSIGRVNRERSKFAGEHTRTNT
jgi:hypothetical protein